MVLARDLRDYPAVQTWIGGLRQQWGQEPEDMDARLDILRRFCEFVGQEPDAIIAECSRQVEGGKRINLKKRRLYAEKIAEFQASVPGDPRQQMRAGNVVRSFMIHNGIFMQAGLSS